MFLPGTWHGLIPLDPEQRLGRAVGDGCSRSPLGRDGFEGHSTAGRLVTDSGMLLTYKKLKQSLTRPCANAVSLQKSQDDLPVRVSLRDVRYPSSVLWCSGIKKCKRAFPCSR